MTHPSSDAYVSRGGGKLAAALDHFRLDVAGCICGDLGSHIGGFVDCLLRRGASRVYAVDTCYGTLAWKLRRDPRVVVFERTNAMHVSLPEPVDLVTIDVGWTPQAKILPNVAGLTHHRLQTGATPASQTGATPARGLKPAARTRPDGHVVSLIKPHYEVPFDRLINGVLPETAVDEVVNAVVKEVAVIGWTVCDTFPSPILGHAGNREVFVLLRPS